jgi:hypothetical protein
MCLRGIRVGECDPIVSAAMAYIKEHLDSVTAEDVSRAVSVSQRSLRRQF